MRTILIALLLISTQAQAAKPDIDNFTKNCRTAVYFTSSEANDLGRFDNTDMQNITACFNYIQAIIDSQAFDLYVRKQPKFFCLPSGQSRGMIAKKVVAYIDSQDEPPSHEATAVFFALNKAYPCSS